MKLENLLVILDSAASAIRKLEFSDIGFEILLLDEYQTSSRCPICKAEVRPFKLRSSPRPWRRKMILLVWFMGCGNVRVRNTERSLTVKNVSGIAMYWQHSTF